MDVLGFRCGNDAGTFSIGAFGTDGPPLPSGLEGWSFIFWRVEEEGVLKGLPECCLFGTLSPASAIRFRFYPPLPTVGIAPCPTLTPCESLQYE